MQGDSLSVLLADVRELADGLEPGQPVSPDVADAAQVLAELLDHYESVLRKHGIPLPYVRDSGGGE
jgi:hypothetical protein